MMMTLAPLAHMLESITEMEAALLSTRVLCQSTIAFSSSKELPPNGRLMHAIIASRKPNMLQLLKL
jgi:hypothetical protein